VAGIPFKAKKMVQNLQKNEDMWTLIGKPKPGDWLYEQIENGQTYDEYVGGKNTQLIQKEKDTIYILPIKS